MDVPHLSYHFFSLFKKLDKIAPISINWIKTICNSRNQIRDTSSFVLASQFVLYTKLPNYRLVIFQDFYIDTEFITCKPAWKKMMSC